MGIDDTIERRWGKRITARGIYRDPVRSSDSHFVKTSGLRWLALLCCLIDKVELDSGRRDWELHSKSCLTSSALYLNCRS
jgi:hypothetical protein